MPTEAFTSDENWTVPAGVFNVTVTVRGGAGGDGRGGGQGAAGGTVKGVLPVTPGETLYLRFPSDGGSEIYSGDGGNSTDIRKGGTALSDRVVVAGGGGGGAEENQAGGAGGGDIAADGEGGSQGGGGGTQSAGGSGGTSNDDDGDDGGFGFGGDGGWVSEGFSNAGGSGGGGWYGGGGGAMDTSGDAGGGGGGSSYTGGLSTVTENSQATSTSREVVLEYDAVAVENLQIIDTTATSHTLSWDAISLETGDVSEYQLYRNTDTGTTRADHTEVATTDGETTSAQDTGLEDGVEYHYRAGATIAVPEIDVDAVSVTDVTESEARLNGDLVQLVDADSADVGFEYRQTGASSWTATATQTFSSPQPFDELVSGLNSNTTYEMRAVGVAGGVTDTSGVISWTTDDDPGQVLGFETGDLSNWSTAANLQVVSDRVFAGSFAAYTNYSGSGSVANAFPFGGDSPELSQFSYAFNERGSADGHAVIIYNNSGGEILRFGSSSIDAKVIGQFGSTTVSSGWADNDEWISFDCVFDWNAMTAEVTASDASNSNTASVNLMNAGGVSEVRIYPAGSPDRLGSFDLDNWFDEFQFLV